MGYYNGNCKRVLHTVFNKTWTMHPKNWRCMTIYHPSSIPYKKDEKDKLDSVGEARTNSLVTFTYGLIQTADPVLAKKQKLIFVWVDTGSHLEDLPTGISDEDGWCVCVCGCECVCVCERESERGVRRNYDVSMP